MRPFAELLHEGIRAGQFGGDIEPHGRQALGFVSFSAEPAFVGLVIDIGSGAGLPALILADAFPDTTWVLIERRTSRADLLRRAVRRLELDHRVDVLGEDAGVVAHGPLRGTADWVTARSFGSPSETAEIAAPFLRRGGSLLTSEPRDGDLEERWPADGLTAAALGFAEEWATPEGRYIRLERTDGDLSHLPRRGARKHPLFHVKHTG